MHNLAHLVSAQIVIRKCSFTCLYCVSFIFKNTLEILRKTYIPPKKNFKNNRLAICLCSFYIFRQSIAGYIITSLTLRSYRKSIFPILLETRRTSPPANQHGVGKFSADVWSRCRKGWPVLCRYLPSFGSYRKLMRSGGAFGSFLSLRGVGLLAKKFYI